LKPLGFSSQPSLGFAVDSGGTSLVDLSGKADLLALKVEGILFLFFISYKHSGLN